VNRITIAAVLGAAWVAAGAAFAADFDGSKRLICATVEARDCVSGSPCYRGLPREIGAPNFFRVDFEKKSLIGPQRTTAIRAMEKDDAQLLLQGVELGYLWVVALDRASGGFSASLTNRDGAFVLFGSCTPL